MALRKWNLKTYSSSEEEYKSSDVDYVLNESGSRDDVVFYNVVTTTGKIIPLKLDCLDTIGSIKVKLQVEEHVNIPYDDQILIFNEKVFEKSHVLINLGIKKGSTITLKRKSEFMIIYIKSPEGIIIQSLEVKPSDTVVNVKAKMPGTRHVLMFNESVLTDNGITLDDLHIVNGTILTLTETSVDPITLMVAYYGRTISLLVKPTSTIADVKKKIQLVVDIPSDEQVLIIDNKVLEDTSTLFDFHINTKSTLKLMHKSTGFMKIYIEIPSKEENFSMYVRLSDTIAVIKAKIKHEVNIPCDEQELIFNEMVLHNNDTLAEHDIKRDTIYNVKSKIQDKERILLSHQRLTYSETPLEDSSTIADYHIDEDKELHLVW